MVVYQVSYFHAGECKKPDKLEATISKEMKKAIKSKEKKERCRIVKGRIEFEQNKRKFSQSDIEKIKKNEAEKVIVIVTKADKKNKSPIYIIKFPNEEHFNGFYKAVASNSDEPDEQSKSQETPSPKKLSRQMSEPSEKTAPSYKEPRDESEKTDEMSVERDESVSYPKSGKQANRSRRQSRASPPSSPRNVKRSGSRSSRRSSYGEKSPVIASTYITTDVLNPPKRGNSPKRGPKKMSPNDFYPTKFESKNRKSQSNLNYLNYVPGKGMIKSNDGNTYFYSSRIRNASSLSNSSRTSSNTSSDRNSSSSSSSTDIYDQTQVFRLVPVKGPTSRGTSNDRRGRASSSSSSDSRSSSSMNNASTPVIDVWRYRDPSADSSQSSSSNGLQKSKPRSRNSKPPRELEYTKCPNCRNRSRSRTKAPNY